MAFGKKKNPISNKITQTHKISVDELFSLSVSSHKEDHLEIDLDEDDGIDELTADDFEDEGSSLR